MDEACRAFLRGGGSGVGVGDREIVGVWTGGGRLRAFDTGIAGGGRVLEDGVDGDERAAPRP